MSAMPAYNYDSRALERDRYEQPDISVVPGRGARSEAPSLSPVVTRAAKVLVAAFVAFVLVNGIGITFTTATTSAAVEAKQLNAQIEAARSEGSTLEVSQSTLSNPTRIKKEAASLGMAAPAETSKFDLSGDVVVTDEAGNLSLSGSIAVAAQS